jgi:LCP family protein required for cell wall assembly
MQEKRNPPRRTYASMDGLLVSGPSKRTGRPMLRIQPKVRPAPAVPPVTRTAMASKQLPPQPIASPPQLNQVKPLKRGKKVRKPWSKRKRSLVFGSLSFIILFMAVSGWLGFKVLNNSSRVFGGGLRGSLAGLVDGSTKLKGEDVGRVNILLAGDSSDDPGHGGAQLTDSMMLVSIDTKNHKAFMVSIPRDLWVNIPNYGGHSKINSLAYYGNTNKFTQAGYPNGGMGLLEKSIAQNFQIPINYYVKVNYTAFRDAVNAVGGVDVNLKSDDARGFYDPNISKPEGGPLKLPNGVNHLNGQTALNLARARGDPTYDGRVEYGFTHSDFTRTQNQRLLLTALKNKALSSGVMANPIKLGQLLDSVGNNVQTDLKLGEMKRLYQVGKDVKDNNLQSLSLEDEKTNTHLLASYSAPDGSSALIPTAGLDSFGQIQLFTRKLTSDDVVVKEAPTVTILNASQVAGLGQRESDALTAKGFNVITVGNAPASSPQTFTVDNSAGKKPNSKSFLTKRYGNTTQQSVKYTPVLSYKTDFVIVLGDTQPASTH